MIRQKRILFCVLLFLAAVVPHRVSAQHVGIKTNLLIDATASPQLGVEIGLAPKWTLDLGASFNAWNFGEKRWRHLIATPGARYWFCDRFAGHFIGIHAQGGIFNVGGLNLPSWMQGIAAGNVSFFGLSKLAGLKENRYQGWCAGGGVSYGYAIMLSRNWNLEFEIGFGYMYFEGDKYKCATCGEKIGRGSMHYIGPDRAAINLGVVF